MHLSGVQQWCVMSFNALCLDNMNKRHGPSAIAVFNTSLKAEYTPCFATAFATAF